MNFEIVGKPALCVNHMQRGLAGEGLFIPNWGPNMPRKELSSGMVEKCRQLADAFRAKNLPVIFVNAIPKPLPFMPSYGDLAREQDAAFPKYVPYYTDERTRKGEEVMPEMGCCDKDYVLYNWKRTSLYQLRSGPALPRPRGRYACLGRVRTKLRQSIRPVSSPPTIG